MFGQLEEVTAAQRRLIALAFGQLVIDTMPFQSLSGQHLSTLQRGDRRRITIVLEGRLELRGELAFQQQAWPLQVVVAASYLAGAGTETLGKTIDHRMIGDRPSILAVWRTSQQGEPGLVLGEHQQVILR